MIPSLQAMNEVPTIFPCWFQLQLTRQGDSINADQWYVENTDDLKDMQHEVKAYLNEILKDALGYGAWGFRLCRMDNPAVLDYYVQIGADHDPARTDKTVPERYEDLISRRVEEHRHIISNRRKGSEGR